MFGGGHFFRFDGTRSRCLLNDEYCCMQEGKFTTFLILWFCPHLEVHSFFSQSFMNNGSRCGHLQDALF
jgi:hypothetical protein